MKNIWQNPNCEKNGQEIQFTGHRPAVHVCKFNWLQRQNYTTGLFKLVLAECWFLQDGVQSEFDNCTRVFTSSSGFSQMISSILDKLSPDENMNGEKNILMLGGNNFSFEWYSAFSLEKDTNLSLDIAFLEWTDTDLSIWSLECERQHRSPPTLSK